MQRISINELMPLFKCVECSIGSLEKHENNLTCADCGALFGFCNSIPALLANDNSLFPQSAYKSAEGGRTTQGKKHFLSRLKQFVPSKSVNLSRDRMFALLARKYGDQDLKILVIGCGNQQAQLEKYFNTNKTRFVFCDIDKAADADLFCDGHSLPFVDSAFDGVITTAVMEHVIRPVEVSAEIRRVLSHDGFVYSETPFMQGVHEEAYDFYRFSLSAHRAIFNGFTEIDTGMVAGPGTALLWMLVDFFRALSRRPRVSQILGLSAQTLFFWIKFTDYFIQHNPRALHAASCTYFYGKKQNEIASDQEIIDRFGQTNFSHT